MFLSRLGINRRTADIVLSIDFYSHFGNGMHGKQERRAIGINFVGRNASLCQRRHFSSRGFPRESWLCIKTEIDAFRYYRPRLIAARSAFFPARILCARCRVSITFTKIWLLPMFQQTARYRLWRWIRV